MLLVVNIAVFVLAIVLMLAIASAASGPASHLAVDSGALPQPRAQRPGPARHAANGESLSVRQHPSRLAKLNAVTMASRASMRARAQAAMNEHAQARESTKACAFATQAGHSLRLDLGLHALQLAFQVAQYQAVDDANKSIDSLDNALPADGAAPVESVAWVG